MRLIAFLPVWVVLAIAARAQAPETKLGSVEGIVVNSVTTEPVRNAVVMLQGTSRPSTPSAAHRDTSAMTDAAGHFRFENVGPGLYTVTADRDGFMASFRRGTPVKVTLAEGEQVQDVAVKLLPLATVEGHVLDDDGDPLIRANVRAMRYEYLRGRKQMTTAGSASTDDRGAFQIADLSPGRYYFLATPPGPDVNMPPRTHWTHPEEAYPITFYPNAMDAGQATATDLSAGAALNNIDFRLQKAPAYHLRGKLSGVTKEALGFVQLRSAQANGVDIVPVMLKQDGSFDQGGIVSGIYYLIFMRQDGGSALYGCQKVNIADQDVNGIVLTPFADLDISGTITVEGAAPDKLTTRVSLEPVEPTMFFRGPSFQMANDGRFTIQPLLREAYRVGVFNIPPGKYVKSIRFGDRDVKDGQINLTTGVTAPLHIVLGADGASVSGAVQTQDGQPAVGALVTIAPEGDNANRGDLFHRTATDAGGKFEIKDLAPGAYRLFAWEEGAEGLVRSAEFRTAFEPQSALVTLDPSGRDTVMLTLISADEIEKQRSKLP